MADGSLEPGTTPQARVFATTHWSVVLAAGEADTPESSAALEKLCRTYWYPEHRERSSAGAAGLRICRRTCIIALCLPLPFP